MRALVETVCLPWIRLRAATLPLARAGVNDTVSA